MEFRIGPLDDVPMGDVRVDAPWLYGYASATSLLTGGDSLPRVEPTPVDPMLESGDVIVLHEVAFEGRIESPPHWEVVGERERPAVARVTVPAPPEGWGQFGVSHDPVKGDVEWLFANERLVEVRPATRTYEIPVRMHEYEHLTSTDGLLRRVVKIVAFRLIAPVAGGAARLFAGRWERGNRPHALWQVDAARGLGHHAPPNWAHLATGPVLLLVHGTFSTVGACYHALAPAPLDALARQYDGRVLAFDHPTLTVHPATNAHWLAHHVPRGLTVDVLCHSRGGLVARVLSERPPHPLAITVRHVVFVATPNAGTVLADVARMKALLDGYTNLLTVVPNPVTDVLAGIVETVKDVAAGALKGLVGLQAMAPAGPFLAGLNGGHGWSGPPYRAIAADFEPSDPGLALWALDHAADLAFGADNDLVVPTEGTYDTGGGPAGFPIADRYLLDDPDRVHHCNYFAHDGVRRRLLHWLPG